jgi:glycosyltransferase involved in cell wall biosynthesis
MAHNINKFLVSRGHEVRVILNQAARHKIKVPYEIDGVLVTGPTDCIDQFLWPDVLLTHLEYTGPTLALANNSLCRRPAIQFVHGDKRYPSVDNAKYARVVYNSKWIAEKLNYKWDSLTFQPFCDYDHINVNDNPIDNEYITLVNLNENKGGKIFWDIARAMPDKKFLGVVGGYDEQFIESLPNVKVVPNTSDIRKYLKQTRVLIMPSEYESWGMIATEAMCNGIPVVCTDTPGLLENCGSAGNYIHDRSNITMWFNAISALDDCRVYSHYLNKSRERAKELCNKDRLLTLEKFIYESIPDYRSKIRGFR